MNSFSFLLSVAILLPFTHICSKEQYEYAKFSFHTLIEPCQGLERDTILPKKLYFFGIITFTQAIHKSAKYQYQINFRST